jgi:hypothetical protein
MLEESESMNRKNEVSVGYGRAYDSRRFVAGEVEAEPSILRRGYESALKRRPDRIGHGRMRVCPLVDCA